MNRVSSLIGQSTRPVLPMAPIFAKVQLPGPGLLSQVSDVWFDSHLTHPMRYLYEESQ